LLRGNMGHANIDVTQKCLRQALVERADFLAVVNFDRRSEDYGKVIATAPFAAPDATGNKPHLGTQNTNIELPPGHGPPT